MREKSKEINVHTVIILVFYAAEINEKICIFKVFIFNEHFIYILATSVVLPQNVKVELSCGSSCINLKMLAERDAREISLLSTCLLS